MPRPRTRITLNLPPETIQTLAQRATTHNETLEDYLTRTLTQAAQTPTTYTRGQPKTPTPPRWKASMKKET